MLFFTNKGRVYRAKAYELPEASRVARGQHVANLLAFQPDEQIAQVIQISNYQVAPYLVLATKNGLVKKTKLEEFDSNRSGGIIAINLRDDDELVGAALIGPEDDLLLVSKHAQAIRFTANDDVLRPMGRATSGVIGMRFTDGDELLSMEVVRDGMDVLVATDGGFAKRTPIEEYPVQGRGGKGVLTAKITSRRGGLVGAVVINPDDELFAITSNGGVIRTPVKPVRRTRDRNTMGVKLMDLPVGRDPHRDCPQRRRAGRTGLVDDGNSGGRQRTCGRARRPRRVRVDQEPPTAAHGSGSGGAPGAASGGSPGSAVEPRQARGLARRPVARRGGVRGRRPARLRYRRRRPVRPGPCPPARARWLRRSPAVSSSRHRRPVRSARRAPIVRLARTHVRVAGTDVRPAAPGSGGGRSRVGHGPGRGRGDHRLGAGVHPGPRHAAATGRARAGAGWRLAGHPGASRRRSERTAVRGAASVGTRPPGVRARPGRPTGPITGAARVTEAVRAARATVSSAAGRTGAAPAGPGCTSSASTRGR